MQTALTLAGRGLGLVAPNPAVGCIIVGTEGGVVGRGWTQPGGRPHAETEAIGRAGDQCQGATAYVTLEPCDHRGKTPPCSVALIDAGIKRVVIACEDPDPRVAGKGGERLKAAGVDVVQGILEAEARTLNAGFMSRLSKGRPLLTLKSATSLDGRIATRTGHSRWITGTEARAAVHMLRARHDAIMVGIGTALADNPSLNCRLPGMEAFSPTRIIADSTLQLPASSAVVQSAGDIPTIIIAGKGADKGKIRELKNKAVKVIEVAPSASGHPAPAAMAKALADEGLNSVLIEGGGKLAGAFMQAGLIDRLAWFHAAKLIGGDGVPSVAAYGVESLPDAPTFYRTSLRTCGEDVFETYERR
ncbi:MAG: bifunctional diaminohydroxyphosphoribosylaminopyrimidine deaminase/5-amino-6-(5-phosphoribosylamino)uracil reductase RibD [Rhodospirillaceae bacterium]|nr:bifunctional diaminohydroxyphosphoribosylaminopyrimidine deaminase/5-amino-6-(5-phosphoribosylamino)uracil reductase RibD [Rhodospirillaceae bacterium]MBL6941890.1 bifunctional diaminohydroxyphosphoribosylaminopyrimidine deaminase/5-amino-6-(5-phosphoribosylamino)uracil reductase RibD [Rhodospirillales bacterium]